MSAPTINTACVVDYMETFDRLSDADLSHHEAALVDLIAADALRGWDLNEVFAERAVAVRAIRRERWASVKDQTAAHLGAQAIAPRHPQVKA